MGLTYENIHAMPTHKLIRRRHLAYLALLAAGVFLLFPRLIGFDRVLHLLKAADPLYLGIALAAEFARYLASASSTIVLARLFYRRVPLLPMTEAFFAGGALNRTFSTGGGPGMFVRLVFLMKQQVHAGAVAAIFLIEDILGLAIGALVFAVGMATLTNLASPKMILQLSLGFLVGSGFFGIAALYAIRRRSSVERIVHYLTALTSRVTERVFHRSVYNSARVQHALDDFYAGLGAARRAPGLVAASLAFNAIRYAAGAATLYFAFFALDQVITPGILILLYTTASVLTTTSAALGEVAIMGTGFVILFHALGLPPEVTAVALILSRAIAFWLPLPVGYLALLHLRRQHYL